MGSYKSVLSMLTSWVQGGLVGREAMIRLHRYASKFDGVSLDLCGLLFLSTPHSGSTEADWNSLLLSLCEVTLGVRSHEIVDQLKPFNYLSVDSQEAFMAMSPVPPFHCFCEGQDTYVFGRHRKVMFSHPPRHRILNGCRS